MEVDTRTSAREPPGREDTVVLAASAVALVLASVLGGATGFATSLLSTPLLLLAGLDLRSVVVVNLAATLVSRLVVLVRDRAFVDLSRVVAVAAGVVPGAWAGALVTGRLDPHVLRVAAGVVVAVLGAVLLLAPRFAGRRPPSRALRVTAGLVGGFLATSTSLNGPPVATLLQRERLEPRRFIADLAAYFVVGNTVSLVVLGVQGHIPVAVLWPALPVLIVAAVVGNQLGGRLTERISAASFRLVTCLLVIASGVVTAVG